VGPAVWGRFSVPADQTVWFYRGVADALAEGWPHPLVEELYEEVDALERLSRA
jgi:hypothetical protein